MSTSTGTTGRPLCLFDHNEFLILRRPPWRSAQYFMNQELLYVHKHFPAPELDETLSDRLLKVNAMFLLDDLEAAGVESLRDLTYWACLASQPDYRVITQEAVGLDSGLELEVNYQTNIAAWSELLYVLRVEEHNRCWPEMQGKGMSQLREKYGKIANELYQRLDHEYIEWGPLSPRLRQRCAARRLNLTRWA